MGSCVHLNHAGSAGRVPVPQLPAGGEDYASGQLHACEPAAPAAQSPAPHVAGLGHGRRALLATASSVSTSISMSRWDTGSPACDVDCNFHSYAKVLAQKLSGGQEKG